MTNKWRLGYDNKKRERVQLENAGAFDELVLMSRKHPGALVHLEQMDTNHWWMQIGDCYVSIYDGKGGVSVNIERGQYGEALGSTGFTDEGLGVVNVQHRAKKAAKKPKKARGGRE